MSSLAVVSPRCLACDHPEIKAIDGMLASRVAAATVAHRFGLNVAAVSRHAAVCKSRARMRDDIYEAALIDLDTLKDTCWQKLVGANAKDTESLSREIRKIHEDIQRVEHSRGLHSRCLSEGAWTGLRNAILGALQPYPEAKTAVENAIVKLEEQDQ